MHPGALCPRCEARRFLQALESRDRHCGDRGGFDRHARGAVGHRCAECAPAVGCDADRVGGTPRAGDRICRNEAPARGRLSAAFDHSPGAISTSVPAGTVQRLWIDSEVLHTRLFKQSVIVRQNFAHAEPVPPSGIVWPPMQIVPLTQTPAAQSAPSAMSPNAPPSGRGPKQSRPASGIQGSWDSRSCRRVSSPGRSISTCAAWMPIPTAA